MEFEPKMPQEPELPAKKMDMPIDNDEHAQKEPSMQQNRGMLAPKTFSQPAEFDIESHRFILNLPDTFENCSLLVFEDGTLGIRMDNTVYECDSSFIGDGVVVEVGDAVRKLDRSDFILTAYNYEKR